MDVDSAHFVYEIRPANPLEMKEIIDGDRVVTIMGSPLKFFGYFRMTNA